MFKGGEKNGVFAQYRLQTIHFAKNVIEKHQYCRGKSYLAKGNNSKSLILWDFETGTAFEIQSAEFVASPD